VTKTVTVQVFMTQEQRDRLAALYEAPYLQPTTEDTQRAARELVSQYDRGDKWPTLIGETFDPGFAGLPEHLQPQGRTPE
jgi:hypothetical protein